MNNGSNERSDDLNAKGITWSVKIDCAVSKGSEVSSSLRQTYGTFVYSEKVVNKRRGFD